METGFDTNFLKVSLAMPAVDFNVCAPRLDNEGYEIKYTHFSTFQHKIRRLPLIAASNICGEEYNAKGRDGDPWHDCEQIDTKYQLDNDFYAKDYNTFDRGHLVRRVDPSWGINSEQADFETFNWANCTPQHGKLNRKGGIWFQLEQHIMEKGVKNKIADISVFSGPVLDNNDLLFYKPFKDSLIQIPTVFWKVIVWRKTDGKLYAVGFMMSQWEFIKDRLINSNVIEKGMKLMKEELSDDYFENLKFADHKTYQVPVKQIEKITGINFRWKNVTFPYKEASYTELKAKPLRKIYTYSDIFDSLKTAYKGNSSDLQPIRHELSDEKKVSPIEVKNLKKSGESYIVKSLEITNMTL